MFSFGVAHPDDHPFFQAKQTPISNVFMCLLQVQSLFYRNIATPLFEEWQRCLNTSLSASMMSNLSSNQARWDLICQQEHLMAESIVSTSSSSGGGGSSFQCESRRDSLEPPLPNYRLSSRSSGNEETSEGDCEDSEPCSPYPYMPLDSVEMAPEALQASWQRRHSLPPPPLLPGILDKADPIAIRQMEANLQQQMSLIEKRRSVQELRRQNNELLANLKLSKRRRIFKGCRSLTTESAEGPKVTFHFLDEDSLPVKDEEQINRRGSAPSTLLLNQINKIANTAAKAAMAGSREASPRGSGACQPSWHGLRNRRSSLPLTDSMPPDFQATDKSRSLSREKVIKKRKLLRRRSAGSGDDYYPASSGCSKRMIHHHRTNPNSSSAAACLAFRRGSLKSSSFGGVGSTLPASGSSKLLKKSNLLRNWQEEQQQLHIHSNNGRRRGSLPLELILC